MPRNNRTAGHQFERDTVNRLKALGFENASTSRYTSRERDDAKVDLCGIDPLNVQCKYTQAINMHKVLKEMPTEENNYNLVYHKRKNQGTVVAMSLSDWEEILGILLEEKIF